MEIQVDEITDPFCQSKKVSLHVARLDALHPVISGNKYFKLKYNIVQAVNERKKGIVSFGGAYSNHLAAAAYACKEAGLKSYAIVRGENTNHLSHTLKFCREQGMQMEFINRQAYKNKEALYQYYQQKLNDYYLVPEGGDNQNGEKGCTEILPQINDSYKYTHIVCAIGTGTTLRGLVKSSLPHQKIIGIVVLKGAEDMNNSIAANLTAYQNFELNHQYHFGGYAKKNNALIKFMNHFYTQHKIPTDFVYTGKLLYAVNDLISKNYFPWESSILCIHSGGLQGNLSLPAETLLF